ncbi:MAG TPA: hypothetical protein VH257_19345, partial [Chloroflexota bacterium]|nr:hypothetical protein [Chloroflexota bacterium]
MNDRGYVVGHPELGLERARLQETLGAMERAIARPIRRTGGADEEAVIALAIQRAWYREELRQALASPYFARLDFHPNVPTPPGVTRCARSTREPSGRGAPEDAGTETFYIGKTHFAAEGMEVIGWQAPLASLFYRATREEASYLAPEGEIRGRLRLKRRLVIDHGQLTHLADDLDTRPAALVPGVPAGAPAGGPTAGLAGALSGPASPWLQDIIATIQPEQFELIAAPGDEVL